MPTRWAATYWREQSKAGKPVKASVINTSSTSGLFGNAGQTNYGAAKTGIATFTQIANTELERYGVRCNAIAPAALTRLTEDLNPDRPAVPPGEFDASRPGQHLAVRGLPGHRGLPDRRAGLLGAGRRGGAVPAVRHRGHASSTDGRWTIDGLAKEAARFATFEFNLGKPY